MIMKKILVLLLSVALLAGCSTDASPEVTTTPEVTVTPEVTITPEVTATPAVNEVVEGKIVELLDDGIAIVEYSNENEELVKIEVTLTKDVEFSLDQIIEIQFNELVGGFIIVSEEGNDNVETTVEPTAKPTVVPTTKPTSAPTAKPTAVPTVAPTVVPTTVPTAVPTVAPTAVPTAKPTVAPTVVPTTVPTAVPTVVPTAVPTAVPVACPGGWDENTPCHELRPGNDPYSAGWDAVFPGDTTNWEQCNAWGQAELDKATAENSNVIRYFCQEIKNNGYGTWGSAGLLVRQQ